MIIRPLLDNTIEYHVINTDGFTYYAYVYNTSLDEITGPIIFNISNEFKHLYEWIT